MLKKIPLRVRFTLTASLFLLVSCVTLTLASNPFLLNFFRGKIHKGGSKVVCVPGLNCYS